MASDGRLIASPASPVSETDEEKAQIVLDVVNQLRSDFAQRDRLYEIIDKIVYLEDAVEIPKAYEKTALEIHTPRPLTIPTTVTSALSLNPPRVQFPPVGRVEALSVQRNATLREHFFNAAWRRQEEEAERQLFRAFMFSLVTYGEGVLKTVERTKTAWADYNSRSAKLKARMEDKEDKEYGELDTDSKDRIYDTKTEEWKQGLPYPVKTVDVDPACFYYLKTLDGFSYCCEISEIPYFDALDRFSSGEKQWSLNTEKQVVPQNMGLPRAQWGQAMGRSSHLTLVELWKWDTVTYVLLGPGQAKGKKWKGGTIVKELQHTYGNEHTKTLRGPYFHAQGITTNSRLPHRAGLGVLTPFLELFPEINSLLTIQGNAAYLTGFPAFQRTVPPGAGEPPSPFGNDDPNTPKRTEDIVPGKIFPFGVGPVEMPRSGPDIDKFLARLLDEIEPALPKILQGVTDDTDNGYLFNQAAHIARLAWEPIVGNAKVALARRVGFESWLLEECVGERVYVQGIIPTKGQVSSQGQSAQLSISPDELNGQHVYNVHMDPETPSNKIVNLRYIEGMLKLGLMTKAQAIESEGGNPDEVEEGLLLEEMKNDPAIRARMREGVFKALGTLEQKTLRGPSNQPDLTQPDGGPPAIGDPNMGAVRTPGAGMPLPGGGAGAPPGFSGPVPGAPPGVRSPGPQHMALPGER